MPRGFRNRQFPKAEVTSVDLGLNSLVNGNFGNLSEESSSVEESKEEAQSSVEVAKNNFRPLADSEQWEDLSALCESKFSEGDSNNSLSALEAKLWWIKAQSKLKSVPLSILEAPFESVKRSLSEISNGSGSELLPLLREVEKELTPSASEIVKHIDPIAPMSESRSKKRAKLFFGAFLVGLLVAAFFLFNSQSSNEEVAIMVPLEEQQPELTPPDPERISRVSHLDAVFYDIDKAPGLDTKFKLDATKQEPKASVKPREREVIDTSGPVEAPEAREARKQPEMVRERFPGTPETEQYDGNKLFGGPKQTSGSDWDRPKFEQYGGGKTFSILVKTKVMPTASTQGIPLGEVKAGDLITAESREGYWLKIRSKNGRFGFILAQDVDSGGR